MDYSTLVKCIFNNDILSKAVEDLANRTKILNLITSEWKHILENSDVYKTHLNGKAKYSKGHSVAKEKAFNRRLKYKNEMYTIIIAGEWSLTKTKEDEYSVISRDCEPLQLIASSMREKTDNILHDGGRFFIRHCNPNLCSDCRSVHKKYEIPLTSQNWCVKSLRIFDGKHITMTFAHILQQSLPKMGSFMGIFRMQIQSRTTFGDDCYKIGGVIDEMIIFQHSILLPAGIICLESTESLPCVEYPNEELIEYKANESPSKRIKCSLK